MSRKVFWNISLQNKRFLNLNLPTKETVCEKIQKEINLSDQPLPQTPVECPWKKAVSVTPTSSTTRPPYDATDNHHGYKGWKHLTLFLCIPVITLMSINLFIFGHHDVEERPEFVPYEYMYIRKKKFPWGDGNKTFFHNPHKNALPDGYEDEH